MSPVAEHADLLIETIAARQGGMISIAQLRAAGLERGAIGHRVATGRLIPIHRGVCGVGHAAPAARSEVFAAMLAVGGYATVSHASATYEWEMLPSPPRLIHVTTSAGKHRHRRGVKVHSCPLPSGHRQLRNQLPITSPALSLLDTAADLSPRQLERALSIARSRGLIRQGELEELRAATPGRRGWGKLGALLSDEAAAEFTRSEAESRLLEIVAAAGLRPPRRNVRVHGFEVDFWWPELRLVIEVDGFAYHGGRLAFEADRERDAELGAHGVMVRRLTWRQMTTNRGATIVRLRRELART